MKDIDGRSRESSGHLARLFWNNPIFRLLSAVMVARILDRTKLNKILGSLISKLGNYCVVTRKKCSCFIGVARAG